MTILVLGTAQFGAAYGVTNAVGRLADDDVSSLVTAARTAGVITFDTAADYGDSQERLGALAPAGNRYVTKFSFPTEGIVDADALFARSAATLRVERLAGVMFHKLSDLRDPRVGGALDVLRAARAHGVIERAGVSIYDAADLELAVEIFPDLDLIQLPANLVDTRLLDHPLVRHLREGGAEIHARSVFLQGILLAVSNTLPAHFAPFEPVLRELDALAERAGTTRLALVVGLLRDSGAVDGVVVGATTTVELEEILAGWNAPAAPTGADLPIVPAELLDPRAWPR